MQVAGSFPACDGRVHGLMGKGSEPCEVSQLILAASADGIVAVDDQGMIRFINRAALELLGRAEDELAGAPFGLPVADGHTAEVEVGDPGGGTPEHP